MNEVIQIENLGKKYIITHQPKEQYPTLREAIVKQTKKIGKGIFNKNKIQIPKKEEFWALRNVNLSITKGEKVGVIGKNGAGKSTLLKLLSRITEPSEGLIRIRGRVASLLEVGTGFHPELTGRENIFLNGAILGMGRSEIKSKFNEIVEFAEVEKFLDTPVKRYSSGMYVRLAFAVAANLESEILLIDEVLAVGDAQFQKKCLGKMENISKEGRTILFVSHNMATISKLCQRCIWIKSGEIKEDGHSDEIITEYLSENQEISGEILWDNIKNAPGDGEFIKLSSVRIINSKNKVTGFVYAEEEFIIELEYFVFKPLSTAGIGFKVTTSFGEDVFISLDHNFAKDEKKVRNPGKFISRCHIPAYLFNQGAYIISLIGHIPGIKYLVKEESVLSFEIMQKDNIFGSGKQPGTIRPVLPWEIIEKPVK